LGRAPRSTLFPYTTLFRSEGGAQARGHTGGLVGRARRCLFAPPEGLGLQGRAGLRPGAKQRQRATARNLVRRNALTSSATPSARSEEHTSELQSRENLVCR